MEEADVSLVLDANDGSTEEEGGDAGCDGCSACATGTEDCDKEPGNGCETNILADPANCGACKRSCLGSACNSGHCEPVVLASGEDQALGIAVDDTHVYWGTSTALGTVKRIPKQGGTPETIASGQDHPFGIAVDAESVFWANYAPESYLHKISKGASTDGGLATALIGLQEMPQLVILDEDHVYWTLPGAVRRLRKNGEDLESLAHDQASTGGIALDLSGLYWARPLANRIMHLSLGADASPTVFLELGCQPGGIALDYGNVYFTRSVCAAEDQAVMSIAKANMKEPLLIAGKQGGPLGIVVDDLHVYWTNNASQQVMKAPKFPSAGAAPTVLASGQAGAIGIAVDSSFVYWTNQTGGQVMKVAK